MQKPTPRSPPTMASLLPPLQRVHAASAMAPRPQLPSVHAVAAYHRVHALQPTPTLTNHTSDSSVRSASPIIIDKRARRKEQCRVNQANYRKRKRQHEQLLAVEIENLQHEIADLTKRRYALASSSSQYHQNDPEHEIAAFYMAMQTPMARWTGPSSVHALQSETFTSLDDLTYAWQCHQQRFEHFALHAVTTERFDAGGSVIIKVDAVLQVTTDGRQTFVFPVQQRFEIDDATQRVTRVTSEVDLIAGVTAATQRSPRAVARILDGLRRY